MVSLKEKYVCFTKDPYNGETLFFAGFTISIFWSVLRTTMFPYSMTAFVVCLAIAVSLMAAKIILFDTYTFKMLVIVVTMFACGVIILLSTGYFWPILWLFVVVAAKDIPFRKILQVYLLMNITIMGLAFFASLLGVIENLAYTSSEAIGRLRYSFGCAYTTDFGAHVFYMLLTAFYLYHERLRWYHYIGALIIDGFVFYFCYAKLDTTCIILTVLFFWIYQIKQSLSKNEQVAVTDISTGEDISKINLFKKTRAYLKYKKLCIRVAAVALPILGLFMYYVSVSYRADSEFMIALDDFVSSRLSLACRGLKQYGIPIFGKNVPMEGMGGSLKHTKPYFFVDSSYLFVLLRYGLLFLCMVFVIYGVICYKHREDTALMLVIVLLAISSSIDHHLMEEAYNPFGYALFASSVVFKRMEVLYES